MKILSILIPVYNAERFLIRCLDSIVTQKACGTDVEIITINDGSKDSSLKILNEYASRYDNIRVISRENKGIGPTRNELIDNVQGEFFWFVDADDYLSEDSLSTILLLLKGNKYDMLLTSYYWGTEEKGKNVTYAGDYDSALELTACDIYNNSVWTRIYRTSIVKNRDIRFNTFGMGEDFDFIFRLIPFVGKVHCIEKSLYNYIYNPASAINSTDKSHKFKMSEDSIRCILHANEYYLNMLSEQQKEIMYKPLSHFILGYIYSIYTQKLPISYKSECIKKLRENKILPLCPLPLEKKKRLFAMVLNNKSLCRLSLLVSNRF